MSCLETWTFGFLHTSGFYVALVMVFWIVGCCSYAEDYCDDVVILAYEFLCCGMPLPLSLIICWLPSSIHLVLPGAYVPSGLLGLVVLYVGTLGLPPMLLQEFLV
jgi:hypothetical protein